MIRRFLTYGRFTQEHRCEWLYVIAWAGIVVGLAVGFAWLLQGG